MVPLMFAGYPAEVLARFKEFHLANPQVYRAFKRMARKQKSLGRDRYSARCIIEVIRWHIDVKTTGDVFEINDDFVPLYARLLIHNHTAEFHGFFELRTVRSRGIRSEEERRRREEEG